jgi:hypothetical protein
MALRSRVPPKPLNTYADLAEQTAARGGVLNVEMMKLRDIHGAGKLGVHVAQNISDRLNSLGMGHFPEVLPQQQWEQVRIYIRGSAVGKLIEAALTINSSSNRTLRDAANNEDSQVVKKIRELVCD